MIHLLRSLLHAGIKSDTPAQDEKYVLRTNFINLTIEVLVVFYGILFYALGAHFQAGLMIGVFLSFITVFLFNRIKWYNAARVLQLSIIAVCVYYFGASFGRQSSVHYLFYVFITLPFILFKADQYFYIIISLLVFVCTFYVMEYDLFPLPLVMNMHGQQVMHSSVVSLVLFWIIANYTYYEITNRAAEKRMKQKNVQLELKNKELEQFLYISSHDLQEPLLSIRVFAEKLREDYEVTLDENGKEYTRFLSEAADRISGQVSALMEYGRLGRNKRSEHVDMGLLVNETVEELRHIIDNKEAKVTRQGIFPVVKGYRDELALLLKHLLSNALKFQKPGARPEIQFRAARQKDHWVFEISDNGIGIDKRNKDRIFDLFARLNSRKDFDGVGIGLSYCRKIVELHQGTIWVESAVGQGSTFYFTISDNIDNEQREDR